MRCWGESDLTPSTPAVFLPWLSCVTRRTARLFAESCQQSYAVDTCSAFVENRLLVTSFLRTVLRRGRPVFCTGFSEGEPWSQERVPGLYPFPFWASH